tara:strand:+ start:276 stop:473 length:198 start_codon:yes stop_codon:yes gene_type:complete
MKDDRVYVIMKSGLSGFSDPHANTPYFPFGYFKDLKEAEDFVDLRRLEEGSTRSYYCEIAYNLSK